MTSRILLAITGLFAIVIQRDTVAVFVALVLIAHEVSELRRDP